MKCKSATLYPTILYLDDFDENKNCEKESKIQELRLQEGGERCSIMSRGELVPASLQFFSILKFSSSLGSEQVQWEGCLKQLSKNLIFKCMPRNVEKVNNIYYKSCLKGLK